ncbi:MAG: S-layer homology domain-containing protein [Ruminococcaceae bacterium]|nr:S-layer homology domain-containing protein [Oscillospiraceae bacterium]
MLKKISAVLLTAIISVASFSAAAAEDDALLLLDSLGIFEGYEDGTYRLENNLTRAEFTKVAVCASENRKAVSGALAVSPYADVPHTLWSAPYIHLAAQKGYVTGYLDSTFRPDDYITYAEATAVFLRLLGYQNSDFGAAWPRGHMEIAENLGLCDGISLDYNAPITRGDTVTILNNLLDQNIKGQTKQYLTALGFSSIEDTVIIATADEDAAVPRGKVSTSAGTYKKNAAFSADWIGCTGELYLENGDTVVAFVPKAQASKSYAVYSVLSDGIIAYKNGAMEKVKLADGLPLYKDNKAAGALSKATLQMGDILRVVYDADGDVDHVILDTGGVEGPFTVLGDAWSSQFPINASTAIMRDGQRVSFDDIEAYDILYYSEALNMVLAYSDKITGVYKSASPSKDTPSSVNVSGTSYAIEGLSAFHKLATGGTFSYGDTVTLLLGREGDVADVLTAGSFNAVAGFVTATGTKLYESNLGEAYSGYTLTLVDAAGSTYEFEADKDYDAFLNRIVTLSFSDGKATAALSEGAGLSGKIDANTLTFGTEPLSPQVKILEVYGPDPYTGGSAGSVFLQRLDGVTVLSSAVLYAARDSQNRISELILSDVTGDLHSYGVVISAQNRSAGMTVAGSYKYIIDGNTGTYQTSGVSYSIGSNAPARFTYAGGKLYSMTRLSEISGTVKSIQSSHLRYTDGSRYDISDADIYLKGSDYSYSQLKVGDVSTDAYTLTAYYDKAAADGGKVRIVIATKK